MSAPAPGQPELLRDPALEARVQAALEAVRPALRSDGGDIQLLGITTDLRAWVRLVGACRTCPAQASTLDLGVERMVRQLVPEITGLLLDKAPPKVGQGGYWGIY